MAWQYDLCRGKLRNAGFGAGYVSDGAVIVHLLKNKIKLPETSVADKEKIISAIEAREKDDKEKKWFFGSTQEEINQQVQMIRTRAAERWLLCFNKCAGA